jgi:hypothetical protein
MINADREINHKIVTEIYDRFKNKHYTKYDEEAHCKLLIKTMLDKDGGTVSAFCMAALTDESTFYKWVNKHELFKNIYYFCKMLAREVWEEEGRRLRDADYPMGTVNYSFEYWKMIGWSRFGISKNSRLKLSLAIDDSPLKHYEQILRQASDGDFTASEFKQLMEAVNVGINVYQTFEMQKQIDELKSNLEVMQTNTNVKNTLANKGIA